jgi:hypothetical protein
MRRLFNETSSETNYIIAAAIASLANDIKVA